MVSLTQWTLSLSKLWEMAKDRGAWQATVHGILQARILEWVDFPFSKDLPNPGIKPRSLVLQTDTLPPEPPGKPLLIKEQY